MRTHDVETAQEPPTSRDGSPKKAYHPPTLVDWGSLFELTGGPGSDIQDGDFTGSGGA
jgi:hypothetical protein